MYEFNNQMRLNIRDPLNPTNNVGRSTFNLYFLKVKIFFKINHYLNIFLSN